jgi:hypothetical protein
MQNCATLRNALRKRNYELPRVSNVVQSGETLRNSLGLNYESPALTAELQAHLPMIMAFFLESAKVVH